MKNDIRKQSFYYYIHGILVPLIVVLCIEMGWRFSGGHIIFGFLGASHAVSFPWIVRTTLFLVIGWRFGYEFADTGWSAAKAGIIAGGVIGVVIGLFEVMWYHNINAWLSLFALPWRTMIVGLVVSGGSGYIFKILRQERTSYLHSK